MIIVCHRFAGQQVERQGALLADEVKMSPDRPSKETNWRKSRWTDTVRLDLRLDEAFVFGEHGPDAWLSS